MLKPGPAVKSAGGMRGAQGRGASGQARDRLRGLETAGSGTGRRPATLAPQVPRPSGTLPGMSLLSRTPRASVLSLTVVVGAAWIGCGPNSADRPVAPASEAAPVAATETAAPRQLPASDPADEAVAVGINGAVSTAEEHASKVGLEVLKAGGNAVDAAVAVGFALAVTNPSAGNVGGGGFMVVRMADGTATAVDYREKAPGKAHRDMYLDKKGNPTGESLTGPKAAGIPGTVAGLATAHAKFGSKPWAELVQPAVDLARKGHVLDEVHANKMKRAVERMRKAKLDGSVPYYAKPDGSLYVVGDTWIQPELANTLEMIAKQGPRSFYEGPFAEDMAKKVADMGGIWTAEDLKAYQAVERQPIQFQYRGHEVITMPPPSAGGVVMRQILAAREILKTYEKEYLSVDEVHQYVEAARRTYADRNLLLADPDFVELPMERLLDVSYMQQRMADIDPNKATPSTEIGAGVEAKKESEQTTHFSIVDAAGNAVSNTYTLNTGFGSKVVVQGTGVLLNNEMNDFAVKPGTANIFGLVQGEQNAIQPNKRMLSSMTPTIVAKDGELRAVVGSPGGSTITTTVVQIVRALVDYDIKIDDAVEAVRIHHQWLPDTIWSEERLTPELEKALEAKGHKIRKRGTIGHANCIEVDPETRGFRAVADIGRQGGKAVAY